MDDFEKEFLKKYKDDHPPVFEMTMFLMGKMNKFNRDLKILIYILISFLFPVYLVVFQFILKK
ncbi:hypothetical protein [Psychrilyobacter atlanticus]|uniref:hypothetical protein n=1 Tax=Psychrilyobacter atlanticus TaxID=271091 RepID=UPI000423C9EC|nr:hypothetical protein [Psychrilyobacter atlanticus]